MGDAGRSPEGNLKKKIRVNLKKLIKTHSGRKMEDRDTGRFEKT